MPKLWADSLDEHRALVRERLVDAFVELLAERPLDDVTVSAVAERAGLARSAVYNHVDHLHDLALLHTERTIAAWVEPFRETADRPALERLAVLVESSLRTFADDPVGGQDLSGHLDEERLARLFGLLGPIRAEVQQLCAQGVERGELLDRDPAALAGFVWAVVGGHRVTVGSGRVDVDTTIALATELLQRALAPSDAGGPPGDA